MNQPAGWHWTPRTQWPTAWTGPSICSATTGGCAVQGRCLRTAENQLRFDDPSAGAYQQAQALSGMLWDTAHNTGMGLEEMARVVFKSVDYLLPVSSYADLLKALLSADLEVHGGQYACAIRDAAAARGLSNETASLDCHDYVSARTPAAL